MRTFSIISLLAAAAVSSVAAEPKAGALGNATVVVNNPPGVVYSASLPAAAFDKAAFPSGNVKGSIAASANPDGIGAWFKVQFSNLPKEGGPFTYHIHVDPVPSDGNCTKTLAHLDPFLRGEDPACDARFPQTCQVGDLSGKHGKITSDPFEMSFYDQFVSTEEGVGAYFGNRSFVIHFANKTRISCANFDMVVGSSATDIPGAPAECAASTVVTSSTSTSTMTLPTTSTPNHTVTGPSTPATPTATPTGPTPVTVSAGNSMQVLNGMAGMISFAVAVMFLL
jgi:hypothetical protein